MDTIQLSIGIENSATEGHPHTFYKVTNFRIPETFMNIQAYFHRQHPRINPSLFHGGC